MTYDQWKTTDPADAEQGPEPPPCEQNYAGRQHRHPRFPSGDCTACGALCTEGCKHDDYEAWEGFQTGDDDEPSMTELELYRYFGSEEHVAEIKKKT